MCVRFGYDNPSAVIIFWLSALSKIPKWCASRESLYVMDVVCRAAFFDEECFQPVMTFFSVLHEAS